MKSKLNKSRVGKDFIWFCCNPHDERVKDAATADKWQWV